MAIIYYSSWNTQHQQAICDFCKIAMVHKKYKDNSYINEAEASQKRPDYWDLSIKISYKKKHFCNKHCKDEYEELYVSRTPERK